MTTLEAFGLVGGVASVLSIPLAIFYARSRIQREKLLAYDRGISHLPLVSARSLAAYKLSVVFEQEGGDEERITSAYVHFLRLANFGREPIRREDIAPHSPLRIEVHGARVLEVALEAVRRPVCNISVQREAPAELEAEAETATVEFDFLDHLDGGVFRILT